MNDVSKLGDAWVGELLRSLKTKRDKHLRHYATCKEGGMFGQQVMKIAQAYDHAYLAVLDLAAQSQEKQQ